MSKVELSQFLEFYSSLTEASKFHTKLNNLDDPLSLSSCQWESEEIMEQDSWFAHISKPEFEKSVQAYEMYVSMSDHDKFISKFRQIQCWVCEGYLWPEHAGLGTSIIFTDLEGNEICSQEGVQCADCMMKYALDVNEFRLVE